MIDHNLSSGTCLALLDWKARQTSKILSFKSCVTGMKVRGCVSHFTLDHGTLTIMFFGGTSEVHLGVTHLRVI